MFNENRVVRYRKKSPDNTMAGAKAYEALLRWRVARDKKLDRPRTDPKPQAPRLDLFADEWFSAQPSQELSATALVAAV